MADDETDVNPDESVVGDDQADKDAPSEAPDSAAEEANEPSTLLDDKGGPDKEQAVPADFPDDWRDRMAGDNKKFHSVLKRYASPQTFANAYWSLRQKQDSGELKAPLPEDATDEQIAAWRKDHGIPEDPSGYDLSSEATGFAIPEEDQPAINEFLKEMHGSNAHPEFVQKAVATFYRQKADAAAGVAERDAAIKVETEDALRAEYGPDYRRNMAGMHGMLDAAPEGLKANLMGARLADGTKLGDNANALRWLVQTARELNPVHSILPGNMDNSLKSITERRKEIREIRRKDPEEYRRNSDLRAEDRRLIEAEQKLKKRDAA